MINAGGCVGLQVQPPRSFGLDDEVPAYGVTSRAHPSKALQRAVTALGVPHPCACPLQQSGASPAISTTALATIEAAEWPAVCTSPISQFYTYGA